MADVTGVHPITKEYGPECGYTYELFSEFGIAELRASYFSCHTGNQVIFKIHCYM